MLNFAFLSRWKWFSPLFILVLVGSSLLLSGCNVCGFDCPQTTQTTSSSPNNPTNTGSGQVAAITPVPTSVHIIWLSKSAASGDVIIGPAVISGDFDVNNTSVKDGQADVGTVIVLLDSSQYTLSGPNSGTLYYVSRGQPSEKELSDKTGQIVSDQHRDGCGEGCRQSKVVYFKNGKQNGTPQYK